MKLRLAKAGALGVLIGMAGLGISISPAGLSLEENIGLDLLFRLRGARPPPPEVLIVGVDKASSDRMELPNDLRKWPRSLHARLTDALAKHGASVIVFDFFFEDPRPGPEDERFAESVRKARNVVLCKRLQTEKISLADTRGEPAAEMGLSRLIPLVPSLERSAAASAPFPLPKVPVKVSKSWTFRTGAGDTLTMPVVAFQIHAMPVYGEFLRLLEKAGPPLAGKLPRREEVDPAPKGVETAVLGLRGIFENAPAIAERMIAEANASPPFPRDPGKERLLRSLIRMYQGDNTRYLNFYGPPRTIPTIRYDQALEIGSGAGARNGRIDVNGKAVFVGSSEVLQQEQKDGFYTVYSQPSGLDISGVEIAATAFANFLEDNPVRPQSFRSHVATIFLWGLAIGVLCRMLPPAYSAAAVSGLCILYLLAARFGFRSGTWYPVIVPAFIQAPLALSSGMIWNYIEVKRERHNIRQAFRHYLPSDIVDQLARKVSDFRADRRLVYGICLVTDAEHYTALSEAMEPEELGSFMNRYYETVFEPVRQHGGVVSNVIGDSMFAIWVSAHPDPALKDRSCCAALDIASAMRRFDPSAGGSPLPTRIGLNAGTLLMGNLGAIDHFEYRPVGDIVNTTTRIEGLNKHLGTRILASEEVLLHANGFLTREVGKFLMAGKSKPVVVHELICRSGDSDELRQSACTLFAEGLNAFRGQRWDDAEEKFLEVVECLGEDGPSRFYLDLCDRYRNHPPGESWDGAVRVEKK